MYLTQIFFFEWNYNTTNYKKKLFNGMLFPFMDSFVFYGTLKYWIWLNILLNGMIYQW